MGGKHDLINIMELKKKGPKNWLRYYVFIRMSFILCILAFLSIAVVKSKDVPKPDPGITLIVLFINGLFHN